MTWSKAKKQLKSLTCDSLSKRLDFHVINYRKAHDQLGRAVITLDKKEILNMCTITAETKEFSMEMDILNSETKHEQATLDPLDLQKLAQQQLANDGIFAEYDFFEALELFFNQSIETSVDSKNDLIKILAILDRRVGKRTLAKLTAKIMNESPLVQQFFHIRLEAEHLI